MVYCPFNLCLFFLQAAEWLDVAASHVQWGQAFASIVWNDSARTVPFQYGDVGDTAGPVLL